MSRRLSNCFNYVGSKFRFLSEINQILPDDSNLMFLDLFGGGGDITVNSKYKYTTYNDKNIFVAEFLKLLRDKSYYYIISKLNETINAYNLNSQNVSGYQALKDDFNSMRILDEQKLIHFYLLVCHSNSNMIRFNSKNEFNLPFGRRTFNRNMRAKLRYASERLGQLSPRIIKKDFKCIDFSNFDVIYADPPYLGTTATYSENGQWTNNEELMLYSKLDEFSKNGGIFAMSNQITAKGNDHPLLPEWVDQNNYKIIYLDSDYDNCNYQRKSGATSEVIVTNYG